MVIAITLKLSSRELQIVHHWEHAMPIDFYIVSSHEVVTLNCFNKT